MHSHSLSNVVRERRQENLCFLKLLFPGTSWLSLTSPTLSQSFVNFNPDTPKNIAGKLLNNQNGTALRKLLWFLTNWFFYLKPFHNSIVRAAQPERATLMDIWKPAVSGAPSSAARSLQDSERPRDFYYSMPHKEWIVFFWADSIWDQENPGPPSSIGVSEQWKTNPTLGMI